MNLQDDESVIQIDKLSNASELYFFKLLMKADTNIGFGEEIVVFDGREDPAFKIRPVCRRVLRKRSVRVGECDGLVG